MTYHESVRVSTETLLEQACQLRLSVGHEARIADTFRILLFSERSDDFSEDVE